MSDFDFSVILINVIVLYFHDEKSLKYFKLKPKKSITKY